MIHLPENCDFKLILKYVILSKFIHYADHKHSYISSISMKKIVKCLESDNIDKNIIKYIKNNYKFSGDFNYYTNSRDLECMVLKDNNELFIIFNGTEFKLNYEGFNDIASFCDCRMKPVGDNIKVHSGYYNVLFNDNIIDKVIHHVKKNKNLTINIIGHSCAGALSSLCTFILSKRFNNLNIKLFTFAAVKPGNKELIDYLENLSNIEITTISNNYDIVPCLPPLGGFCHFTNIINIFNDSSIIINSNPSIFNHYSINDHYLNSYVNTIFKLIDK
jgi:predicted lipase